MGFKEQVENNPFIALSIVAITAATTGWVAHITLLSQTKQDVIIQGTYVLKEQIESGASKLYVSRAELEKVQKENAALTEKITQASRQKNETKLPNEDYKLNLLKLTKCQDKVAELQNKYISPNKQNCSTILDNYYIDSRVGKYNITTCIAESKNAATNLGATVLPIKNNNIAMQNFLGTAEGYYCNVACYENLISVSCNSLANRASIGLTAQIRDFLSYK